ncbi:hypothetical protein TWF730_002059 [Orbilia blumenaviensis]|uniref:Uncharacterized protein n=1 Tax=Orbilia blumenaviensis TaxID=1796055 RepID=A0AAV9UDP2_9PEZI
MEGSSWPYSAATLQQIAAQSLQSAGSGGNDPPRKGSQDINHGNCGGDDEFVQQISYEELVLEDSEAQAEAEGTQESQSEGKPKKPYDSVQRKTHYADHNKVAQDGLKDAMVASLNRHLGPKKNGTQWTSADTRRSHFFRSERPPDGHLEADFYWRPTRDFAESEKDARNAWNTTFARNSTASRWGSQSLNAVAELIRSDRVIPSNSFRRPVPSSVGHSGASVPISQTGPLPPTTLARTPVQALSNTPRSLPPQQPQTRTQQSDPIDATDPARFRAVMEAHGFRGHMPPTVTHPPLNSSGSQLSPTQSEYRPAEPRRLGLIGYNPDDYNANVTQRPPTQNLGTPSVAPYTDPRTGLTFPHAPNQNPHGQNPPGQRPPPRPKF